MTFSQRAAAALLLGAAAVVEAAEPPVFIDPSDLRDPVFVCMHPKDAEEAFTEKEQPLVEQLWRETLAYLEAYARAVATDTTGRCRHSDTAVTETVDGIRTLCITDREDVRRAVKQIHQILAAPDRARACFSPRRGDRSLLMPSGRLLEKSPVAQWLRRPTLESFFKQDVKNRNVQRAGRQFAANFDDMVLGSALKTPANFGRDVTANALPNLWASVGWIPMYAAESERNKRNFTGVRGGYAYGEVLGHWGLLAIRSVNGVPMGAEIGMTVQSAGTLYPYHNHAIAEMYYTLREPASPGQFKSFAVRDNNPRLKTVREDARERQVEFDAGDVREPEWWAATAWNRAPLVYFHENTIHAFDMGATGEKHPASSAMVAVWARTNADDTRNDYGNTRLCQSAAEPDAPARRGMPLRCELTQMKY